MHAQPCPSHRFVFLCQLFPVLGFNMIQITHCQCVCNYWQYQLELMCACCRSFVLLSWAQGTSWCTTRCNSWCAQYSQCNFVSSYIYIYDINISNYWTFPYVHMQVGAHTYTHLDKSLSMRSTCTSRKTKTLCQRLLRFRKRARHAGAQMMRMLSRSITSTWHRFSTALPAWLITRLFRVEVFFTKLCQWTISIL